MNASKATSKPVEGVMVSSSSSDSESVIREIDECDETKTEKEEIKDQKASNNNNNNNNKEEIKIFIYIKENDKTISVKTNKNMKIKCILHSIIQQNKNSNICHKLLLKHKYFLINSKNKHVLNPERSLSHYNIQNKYILILAKKKCKKNNVENKKQKKLTIICSFGAPYNNKKLLSSYHGDVSLDQYAFKIKEKFSMCQSMKITFNFHGIPCLGKDRKCGINKLGIKENDEIIAQTNGINLTLKSFSSPYNIKVIEMYKYFDLNMLKKQIKIELKIPMINQKALICKGWKLIDHDMKCREIKQYETITIIECCGCNLIKQNKQKNNNNNNHNNNECIQHQNQNDEYYLTQSNHSHSHHSHHSHSHHHIHQFPDYHYYPEHVNKYNNEQIPINYEFMEYPPNYTNYTNYTNNNNNHHHHYEQYGGFDNNNNHYDEYYEYDASGPIEMDQMDRMHDVGMDGYGPNQYDDNIDDTAPFNQQKVEMMNFINSNNQNNNNNINDEYLDGDKLKICRYGNNCRYFRNPHISGPCRYYHPPTTLQHDYSWKSYYTLHHGTTKKNKYKTNYTIQ